MRRLGLIEMSARSKLRSSLGNPSVDDSNDDDVENVNEAEQRFPAQNRRFRLAKLCYGIAVQCTFSFELFGENVMNYTHFLLVFPAPVSRNPLANGL